MHAAEFVDAFAKRIGKEPKSIRVYDRALAESGLRQKSKGRHFPEMKTLEAVLLLLAIMSGKPAIHATDNALRLAYLNQKKPKNDEYVYSIHDMEKVEKLFNMPFSLTFGIPYRKFNVEKFYEISLLEFMCLIIDRIRLYKFRRWFCNIKIENFVVEIVIGISKTHIENRIIFLESNGSYFFPDYSEAKSVGSSLLLWIAENTVEG